MHGAVARNVAAFEYCMRFLGAYRIRGRVSTLLSLRSSRIKLLNMGGTAEFGWGPEDPVDEGQLELRGVVFTESSGGSPLASLVFMFIQPICAQVSYVE